MEINYPETKVRVVCPIRNREWLLDLWLKAIDEWEYLPKKLSFHFLVNDCVDKTYEVLMDWMNKRQYKYRNITVTLFNLGAIEDERIANVRFEIYKNLAFLRNYLLDALQDEDYVFTIDSDILIEKSVLREMVSEELPILAGVISNRYNPNLCVKQDLNQAYPDRYLHYYDYPKNAIFNVDWTGALMLLNRETALKVRYEAPILGATRHGEDLGFCRNAQHMGIEVKATSKIDECLHIMEKGWLCHPEWIQKIDAFFTEKGVNMLGS